VPTKDGLANVSAVSRSLEILELLARSPEGVPLTVLAGDLDIPQSAAHRLLTELIDLGYVRRAADSTSYSLAMKQLTQSLTYLSKIDLVDLAKASVDRLAEASRGLARLGIMDNSRMLWVLKSQGSLSNIRYDPPMNYDVQLSCSASGFAWLAQLSNEAALELVLAQGIKTDGFGKNAPGTVHEILDHLEETRRNGFAFGTDMYEDGITNLAVAIVNPELGFVTGVLSLANLNSYMTTEVVDRLVPLMQSEASALSDARLDYVKYLLPVDKNRP
jgi:IclR family acetate operon transcriptional repressor